MGNSNIQHPASSIEFNGYLLRLPGIKAAIFPRTVRFSANLLVAFLLALAGGRGAFAQVAQSNFGRNRIQYSQEKWQYLISNHFDVYYGQSSEAYARRAIAIAEQEYLRITELIGYSPYNRIRFYLYDSPLRLSESNVGLETSATLLGGKTSFLKSIIEVSYTRSQAELRREVARGLARSMIYDMMYGGSFTEAVQNSYLMMLPEWFTEGAVAYAAEGWSLQLDNWARDEAEAGRMRRPSARNGQEAEWLGQSLWAFIAERYGRSNVSNILNLTRIIRNEESAISSTLGISYNKVLREWRTGYSALAEQTKQIMAPLPEDKLLKLRLRPEDQIFGIALSPSGRFAAWASQDEGRTRVGIKDLLTGRQRVLWRQGERHHDTKAVPMSPVAFVGSERIATVHHRGGQMELLVLTISGKVFERFPLGDIDQVQHLAFSDDGKKGVLIGSDHGQTDLYQINPRSGKIRKLTDDLADEADPVLDEEGNHVYYASTQLEPGDTAGLSSTGRRIAVRNRIYKLSLNAKALPVRVAEARGSLTGPQLHPELGLLAVSDESGALNLVQIDSGRAGAPVTGFASSLDRVATSFKTGHAVALVRFDGRTRLLKMDSLAVLEQGRLPETPWRENHPLRPAEADRVVLHPIKPQDMTVPTSPADSSATQQSQPVAKAPAPAVVAPLAPLAVPATPPPTTEVDPAIDIRNYVFEDEKAQPATQAANAPATPAAPAPTPARRLGQLPASGVAVSGALPPGAGSASAMPTLQEARSGRKLIQKDVYQPPVIVQGPFPSMNRLSSNSVTTSFAVDPYRGWGVLIEAGMADYFENHKFQVRALPFLDLRQAILQADYQYLKHRVDFSAHFSKNALFITDNYLQKNYLYKYQVGASYPISRSFRVAAFPYYQETEYYNLTDNSANSPYGDKSRGYLGGRLELVFDNSYTNASNITTGSKMRLVAENNAALKRPEGSFGSVYVDLRRYQKVHKEITLALRASAGRNFGPAKKQYMLGGMDNWLFNQFSDRSTQASDNPLLAPTLQTEGHADWFFNSFVTNMRGFDYNAMNGNNFVLLNAELRMPLIKYLYKGPIASNFMRNFQVVTFSDIGSAWSGGSLLSKENTINTTITKQNPFTITTINSRSPFLIGYGAGVRTMMLGYYVKFDFALGRQDYTTLNKRFYLTLGYDF